MVSLVNRRTKTLRARRSRFAGAPFAFAARSYAWTTVVVWIAAAALLFEEWLWDRSTRAIARFVFTAHLSAIENWVRRRTPAQALCVFMLPVLIIYPFKVLALIALARGNVVLGGLAFLAAKFVATALFARLYQLTEPAILDFAFIRRVKAWVQKVRVFTHAWLDAQPAYRHARAAVIDRSAHVARRYRAACRLHRYRGPRIYRLR